MIGIIIELIISWLLLWYIDKKKLSVLGFRPSRNRITNWIIGFLLAASVCTLYHVMSKILADNGWIINKHMTTQILLTSSWWTLKSVIFEELIFRGALLYLAIGRLGIKKACYLSAVCFGIYHLFSYNAFGNPFQMLIIFLMTGIFGLMLAFAFAKTKSLYLPFALHLGWNLFNIVVFSNGPLGQQIFIKINENKLEGILSLFVFLFQIFALPLLVYWYLRFLKDKTPPSQKKEAV
ncbi:membrane protease YdiL (CAAX protease family) [Chryseobacterium sp. H1D6B]|uniref:CPBP family intramembrane glutamic endopeptidase n=1 Tax=Chryseobacterium sp. H1D6B TaxID=2940588 RepID=UPI0015CB3BA5|nr:CPBP family intramembrane glutamic endopeptidase [Chryseobacterium sp. H1D6B]MDH6252167.1 membrane protease YdiL (CAAX protease family) [Chryseobacterium sp. H1D6B]